MSGRGGQTNNVGREKKLMLVSASSEAVEEREAKSPAKENRRVIKR